MSTDSTPRLGRPFAEGFAPDLINARVLRWPNDERIAEFVVPCLETPAFPTSDSLPQAVGGSRNAVVRFARPTYTSLPDLRRRGGQVLGPCALPEAYFLADVRGEVQLVDPAFADEQANLDKGYGAIPSLSRSYSRLITELPGDLPNAGAELVVVIDGRQRDHNARARATERRTLYDSIAAPLCLIGTLVAEVAGRDPRRTRATLKRAERFREDRRFL